MPGGGLVNGRREETLLTTYPFRPEAGRARAIKEAKYQMRKEKSANILKHVVECNKFVGSTGGLVSFGV